MTSRRNERMLRVDQAGEYGATRIYAGQLAVMGTRARHSTEIGGMADQEESHRARVDAMMAQRGVRPTLLQPVWSVAGYALGAATALIGPEAAMACTAAIETEIDRHYTAQLDELDEDDKEIILMRHFEHLGNSEAAEALGLSAAAAGMRYLRALRRLRGILGDHPSLG